VSVGDKDPVDFMNGPADALESRFEDGEGFRCIEAGVEEGCTSVVNESENINMLEPEGHGQSDHVKIACDFFNQGRTPF
jgi:hypothetical protein